MDDGELEEILLKAIKDNIDNYFIFCKSIGLDEYAVSDSLISYIKNR